MQHTDFSSQFLYFSLSLAVGMISGITYSLFKILRGIYSGKISVIVISDILFMFLFTVITLVFSIGFTDGFVRYYVLTGEILGFFLYKISIGKLFDRLFAFMIMILRKSVYYIQKIFVGFIKKLLKASDKMLYNKEYKNHTCMKRKERRT